MFRKNTLVFFIFCALAAITVSAQDADFTPQKLAGTYSVATAWTSHDITLNADSTYSAISTSDLCVVASAEPADDPDSRECLNFPLESGTFSIAGRTLLFNPQSSRRYEAGSFIMTLPPVYEFSVVTWAERFYLIKKEGLKQFADAVNLKIEPHKNISVFGENYFLLRREGINKPVVGLPDLPDEWNDILLKKPVEAIVLSVAMRNGERIAVIDKGSRDGLKVGVQIVTNYFPEGSEVISVKKTSAEVRLKYDLKKGAKVRTFFDPANWIRDGVDVR